jgi:leukotriene-A4 hydrolase
MSSLALQYFLDVLKTKPPLSVQVLEAMEKTYSFNRTENAEIKYRWLRLCLRGRWSASYPLVIELLSKQGRMKYIVPLYRELCECGEEAKAMATATFTANEHFYQMMAAKKISDILKNSGCF